MNALIVLGGQKPSSGLLQELAKRASLVLCADSGLEAALEGGIRPDAVIGDMDSVSDHLLNRYASENGKVLRLPREKDDTDGVAVLDYAIGLGVKQITLTGALGGRLDHALANCMLLVRAANRGLSACIEEDGQHIELLRGCRKIEGHSGQTFSLLSFWAAHVASLVGAHYPLCDYAMRSDYPIGISNLFETSCIRVEVDAGDVLFFQIK